MTEDRVMVIGLDGADIDVILKGINNGYLSNMGELVEQGEISAMKSPLPPVTPVSMSSILTGDSPGKHGVYAFDRDALKNTGYNDYRDIQSSTIFEVMESEKIISINTPMTTPPPESKGKIVGGFPANSRKKAWPPDLDMELRGSDYRVEPVDIDEGEKEFVQDVFELAEKRFELSERWIEKDWELFMLWFTGDARLQHYIEDEKTVMEFYKKVDQYLGELIDRLKDEPSVFVVSDHGFSELEVEFNIGGWLRREGYMSSQDTEWSELYGKIENTEELDAYPSAAYMGGLKVKPDIEDEIKKKLEELQYNGEKVFRDVFTGEELYGTSEGPDLIPVPTRGFNHVSKPSEKLFNEDPEEVKTPDREGVLITNRDDLDLSDPLARDIMPTLMEILGVEMSKEGESLVN